MKKILVAFLYSLLLWSCTKDLENLTNPDWEPEVAIAITNSRFEVEDILNDFETGGYVGTNEEGVIRVVYQGEIFTITAEDVLELDNIPYAFLSKVQEGTIPSVGGRKLETMALNSGIMTYQVIDSRNQSIDITINIPIATKDGVPFSQSFTVTPSGGTINQSGIFSLNGYTFDFTTGGDGNNFLSMNYEATLVGSGTSVDIDLIQGTFKGLEFAFLDGYIGDFELGEFSDSVKIDMFKNYIGGEVVISEPRIAVNLYNSFGLPLQTSLSDIQGTGNNGVVALTGEPFNDDIELEIPDVNDSEPAKTVVEFDGSNSNLDEFITNSPSNVDFTVGAAANVAKDSTQYNWVRDTSRLTMDVDIEIPMVGRISGVTIRDEFSYDFSDFENIDNATFKLIIENRFPLAADIQLYYLDEFNNIIDSLLPDEDRLFSPSIVDANGLSISSSTETNFFEMNSEKFERLKATRTVQIIVIFNTSDEGQTVVRFHEDDFLDLKMGLITKFN